MLLEKYLKSFYDLPNESKLLNIVDIISIHLDFDKYQNNLSNFLNYIKSHNLVLDTNEKIILDYETSPYRYLLFLIRQNYFNNYYLELELILNGINSPCTEEVYETNIRLLNHIFAKRDNILKMNDIIVNIYEKIINCDYPLSTKYDLRKFYNKDLLERFIKSLELSRPSKYDKRLDKKHINKLNLIYDNLLLACGKTRKYLIGLLEKDIFNTHSDRYGLSNFDSEFYIFNLSYVCGLKLRSNSDIEYLYEWANSYLKYNLKKINQIIKKIDPTINQQLNHKDKIQLITLNNKYKFKSKEEIINTYLKKIDECHNFIVDNKFPLTNKCSLVTFNNPATSAGFYLNNCFHLNLANWHNQRKFETRALTMHETYPGHHLQIDISLNHNPNNYLTTLYQEIFSSYVEGWALFAEKIHSDKDLVSDFGELDSDLLRILRIIADIDIHYWGKSPLEVIDKLNKYLALDRTLIIPEVYRYVVLPAQAISYKIGESIFMGIYYKQKGDSNLKINDPIMLNEYKKILLLGECTSEELLRRYSMKFFNSK
jgi:hypothetical protein